MGRYAKLAAIAFLLQSALGCLSTIEGDGALTGDGGDTDGDNDGDGDSDSDTDTDTSTETDGGTDEPAVCGDGVVDFGEECDDANDVDWDGCNDCRTSAIQLDWDASDGLASKPDVAFLPGGGFALIWFSFLELSDSMEGTLYLQIFDDVGEPASEQIVVSENAWTASIDFNEDGRIVIAWSAKVGEHIYDLFGRVYDSTGSPISDVIKVNPEAPGRNCAVAMTADGSFVVVWEIPNEEFPPSQEGSNGLRMRLFQADGAPQTDEITIYESPCYTNWAPAVEMASDGSFVVFYFETADLASTLWYMRFDSEGVLLSKKGMSGSPAYISMLPDGSFAAAYQGFYMPDWDWVFAQAFDENGNEIAPSFNTGLPPCIETRAGYFAQIAGFNQQQEIYVFWSMVEEEIGEYVYTSFNLAQRFNPDGSIAGERFVFVDEELVQGPLSYAIDMKPNGTFVVAWSMDIFSPFPDAPVDGKVFFQRFDREGTPLGKAPWPSGDF